MLFQLLFFVLFVRSDLIGQNRLLNNVDEFNLRKFHPASSTNLPPALVLQLAKHLLRPRVRPHGGLDRSSVQRANMHAKKSYEVAKTLVAQVTKQNLRKFTRPKFKSRYESFIKNFNRH